MKKMVSVMLETALAIALACVGIGAARTAASAEEGKLTLLGDTDTYEESHWQDYLPAPEAVQGDNQWTVYAGTVEGTRIECTHAKRRRLVAACGRFVERRLLQRIFQLCGRRRRGGELGGARGRNGKVQGKEGVNILWRRVYL